jgi:predicted ester cyclase
MSLEQDNINVYIRFLNSFNAKNLDDLDNTFHESFKDHHPGFDLNSLADYRAALGFAHDVLAIQGILESVIATGDKVITRVALKGKHIGNCFGIEPTGKDVSWSTIEIWRVENGKFAERWAQDDMLGLLKQMGVPLPI